MKLTDLTLDPRFTVEETDYCHIVSFGENSVSVSVDKDGYQIGYLTDSIKSPILASAAIYNKLTGEELIYLPRKFEGLNGLVLTKIELSDSELHFHTRCGRHLVSYHEQDCCESVWLESYDGCLLDLINSKITMAEKSVVKTSVDCESQTATFYKLSTNKGSCTFTWRGESNGYYSESVDFAEIVKEKDAV